MTDQIFRGWRTYHLELDLSGGKAELYGSIRKWEKGTFEARCEFSDGGSVEPCLLNLEYGQEKHFQEGGLLFGAAQPNFREFQTPTCGVYTLKKPELPASPGSVVAACVSYGTVVEHEDGYRASHTRIEQMYLVMDDEAEVGPYIKGLCDELCQRYDAPAQPIARATFHKMFEFDYEAWLSRTATSGLQHQQFLSQMLRSLSWPTSVSPSAPTQPSPSQNVPQPTSQRPWSSLFGRLNGNP